MTFIDFEICDLPVTLPVLYSVTLIYFFKVKCLKRQYVQNGESLRKSARGVICKFQYRMASLRMLYSLTLTYFFHDQIFQVDVSNTLRASAKLEMMTFVYFNIFYQMASLRMLYSLTVTYF